MWATTDLKESTQQNDTAVDSVFLADEDETAEEVVDENARVEHLSSTMPDRTMMQSSGTIGLTDEDMIQGMSEQMNDLLTTLDGVGDADADVAAPSSSLSSLEETIDDEIPLDVADSTEDSSEVMYLPEEPISDIDQETSIYEEGDDSDDNDDFEDPALKNLEETLLTTIQVLEDTLHETQIVNELETRELKEEQSRLQAELDAQKKLNEMAMNQLQVERFLLDQLAFQKQQAQPVGLEDIADPSLVPPEDLLITPSDLAKLLQIQQEQHFYETEVLANKLENEENERLVMEEANARLEAVASAAKAIVEDAKQEDTVLQRKLQEQQEQLELTNRKVEKLDAELSTSKQALTNQTITAKSDQAAAKTKEKELQDSIAKLESQVRKLTTTDTKAQASIAKLEDIQAMLEESLKSAKHDKATSKTAATAAQKELKQAKQQLAESMVKIGRLETKLAKAETKQQLPPKPKLQQKPQRSGPPKKAATPAKTQQSPKEPEIATAQKVCTSEKRQGMVDCVSTY